MILFLIRLFPRAFRERFGEELLLLSEDLCRAAAVQGRGALWLTWLRCLGDLLQVALYERISSMSRETRNALWLALLCGLIFGWFDTRTKTDDTGIVAGLIFLLSFSVAAVFPKRPWLTGAVVGLGVPLCHALALLTGREAPVPLSKYLETFIAVIPAVMGALLGSGSRRIEQNIRVALHRK